MNGGTTRGAAYGIKLDILAKLENIKPIQVQATGLNLPVNFAQRGTLLHFVVEIMMSQHEEKCVFFELWAAVWEAARVISYRTSPNYDSFTIKCIS